MAWAALQRPAIRSDLIRRRDALDEQFHRKVAIALISAAAMVEPRSRLAAQSTSANGHATVADLGVLGGCNTGHVATAINASAIAVGFARKDFDSQGPCTGTELAVRFNPPVAVYVDQNPPFDLASRASSINNAGVIVGTGTGGVFAGAGNWLPPLPPPAGGSTLASMSTSGRFINNAGEVLGVTSFDPGVNTDVHATLWIKGLQPTWAPFKEPTTRFQSANE